MEAAPETLNALAGWFAQTFSRDAAAIRAAEQSLSAAAASPGFALALLALASSPCHDHQARFAASVHFKNLLRTRWTDDADDHPLPPSDRDVIKAHILRLLLAAPPLVQGQLSQALATAAAAASDFPARWDSLLPSIVSSLGAAVSAGNVPATNSLLATALPLFSRFRTDFDTAPLRIDLIYCLEAFAAALLQVFLSTSRRLLQAPSADAVVPVLECLRLCCEIFYALNYVDLPGFFEDHMLEWMTEFRAFLTASYPPAVEAHGAPDALRAAVCHNLQLYMEKYEEELRPYLKEFVEAVWGLLLPTVVSRPSLAVTVTVTAIRFLTTVAGSVHHALSESPDVMKQICDSAIVPNLRPRDEDEELFEMNWVEYVRRDAEGSGTDTPRHAASQLLRGLAANHRQQVALIASAQVQQMLAAKDKDAAIHLVIALMQMKPRALTVVDMESFFTSVIMPELQAPDWKSEPMLKATALRFLKEFKDGLPTATALALLPSVTMFLTHDSNVVHSYAAIFIENLLITKDDVPGAVDVVLTRASRYVAANINPFVQQIVQGLSKALSYRDSYENPYLIKCLVRVLGVATLGAQTIYEITARLADILLQLCDTHSNPDFS